MKEEEKTCANCIWWQNCDTRVNAKISGCYGPRWVDGLIELRECQCKPSPNAEPRASVYTDEKYCCGSWQYKDGSLETYKIDMSHDCPICGHDHYRKEEAEEDDIEAISLQGVNNAPKG